MKAIIKELIAQYPKQAALYKTNEEEAMRFFVAQTMRRLPQGDITDYSKTLRNVNMELRNQLTVKR